MLKAVKRVAMKLVAGVSLALVLGVPARPAAAQSWRYTALGDSVATGLLAWKGYVPRYREFIIADTGATVSLTNYAKNGDGSIGLLNLLNLDSTVQATVGGSQVITFNVGGNDLRYARDMYRAGSCGGADGQDCLRNIIPKFKGNYENIIKKILTLRALPLNGTPNTSTIIRTMDVYNPYVNSDKASDSWKSDDNLALEGVQSYNDFQVFKPWVDDMNAFIQAKAAQYNIPCARVYAAFNGPTGEVDPSAYGYIQFDGLHPSDKGHGVIATLLRNLGYAPLK